jgi:uncharacterized protein (AIM24 family)
MSAGFTTNLSLTQVNNQVGTIMVNVRNSLQAAANWNAWVTACGGATYLESIGMASGDAAAVIAAFGNMQAVVNAYQGTGTIATEFNYMANTDTLWGGQ